MNKYSELTDEEVNQNILILTKGVYVARIMIHGCQSIDFCNSWNDTGPLMFDLIRDNWEIYITDTVVKISNWDIPTGGEFEIHHNKNELRAICECILLINDREDK